MNNGNDARRHYLAAKLAAHTATEAERDEAIGTILISLWGKEDVERIIDERHHDLCKECPAKKLAEDGNLGGQTLKEKIIMKALEIIGWALVILGGLAGAAKLIEGLHR